MTLLKIRKILLFLPILLPLVFTPWTYQPWIFGKTILAFAVIQLAMVLLAIDIYRGQEKEGFSYNKLDISILVFLLVAILAVFFSFDNNRAIFGTVSRMLGLVTYIHLFFYYLLLRRSFNHSDWQKIWPATAVVGLLSIMVAWLGPSLKIFDMVIPGGYERLNGVIGNPIFFASYLWILITIMALAIFVDNKHSKFYWATIILSLVTIFATGTRGAIIALAAALLFFFIVLLFFSQGNKKFKITTLVIFVIIAAMGVMVYTRPSLLDKAPYAIRQGFNISLSGLGAETRLMAWQISWQGLMQRPLLGWGLSNFSYVMDKNYNPRFLSYGFTETTWDIPHNSFFEVLVSVGIIGLASLMFLLFRLFQNIFLLYKEKENNRVYLIFLLATIFGYFVQSLFTSEGSNTLFYLVILVAFFQFNNHDSKNFNFQYSKMIFYVLGIIGVGGLYWSYLSLNMAHHLVKADDAAALGSAREWQYEALKTMDYNVGWQADQAVYLTTNLQKFSAEQRKDADFSSINEKLNQIFDQKNKILGNNYWYNYWQAQVYGNMGEMVDTKYFDTAIAKLDLAGQFAPNRQHVPLLKARYLLGQSKINEAKKILADLIAKDDSYSQPHWFYGLAMVMDNDLEGGLKELERAVELGFELNQETNIEYMITLYAETKQYAKIGPLMQKLIEMQPSNAILYIRMGLVYAEIGNQTDKVIEYFNQALLIDPELRTEVNNILIRYNIKEN